MQKPSYGSTETRTIMAGSLRADDSKFQVSGIAAAYNTLSANLGGFKEKIQPGAFARSLREKADVKCLLQHDPSKILGRTKSGTLTLRDTPAGLAFVCQLDRTNTDHCNAYAAVKRGDLSECSFAFTVPAGGDSWDDSDRSDSAVMAIRTLKDVNLLDVSLVAYPAYPSGTSVDARVSRGSQIDPQKTTAMQDRFRRLKAKALGDAILDDAMRALQPEDVSSLVRKSLATALAGMAKPQAYVCHGDKFVYSIPEDFDPDNEEESCRVSKWQYGINPDGSVNLMAARYNAEESPEGPDVEIKATPVRISLREQNVLRMRMRQSAGIFTRR